MLPDFQGVRHFKNDKIYPDGLKVSSSKGFRSLKIQTKSVKSRLNQAEDDLKNYEIEWLNSCVSSVVIAANVEWLDGDDAIETICGDYLESLGGWSTQMATAPVRRTKALYSHLEAGGFYVAGLDPLNEWARMDWGQMKPINPRNARKQNASGEWVTTTKPIKYEGHYKQPTRAFFLSGAVDWPTVQLDLSIPRLHTEGAKKAGAALTAGYAAIALPGVHNGYRTKDRLGNPVSAHLIPDIAAIAQPGSIHYLAFDQDANPETRQKVAVALSRYGQLLMATGGKVHIVRWDSSKGKGLDDLIANHGAEALHQAVSEALTFEEWQLWQALEQRLTITPSVSLRVNDLTVLQPESVPATGIIAISSGKGTGKTKLIGGLIEGKDKAVLAGHRISLMRNLSERCGVSYRGDIDKQGGRFIAGDAYTLRVGTCVDSLMSINPSAFVGCELVLDEVCQVLRHLLTSSTCNKDGMRPVLLGRFAELLQAAKRVIIADADLDNKAINYIRRLRGDDSSLFLIRNDYQAPGYDVKFIESPDASAITGELLNDLRAGVRVYIATDSKRGSKRLHRLIEKLEGEVPQLLINSETSGGKVEREFMENPDQHLTEFTLQAVTTSPSACTGLSIEGKHIDKVYGIFYGASSNDADMAQSLIRVREPVPRVVWCAKYGRNFSKAGREGSPLKLRNMLKQKTDASTLLIRAGLSELTNAGIANYDWINDPHIDYWSHIEAERNRSMWGLRTALKIRLIHEGHKLAPIELAPDKQANELLKAAREDSKVEYALSVAAATSLSPVEAKQLEQLDGLDTPQRLALTKWQIAEFYCLPVDEVGAELVAWDNDGRRRGQLLNLEHFLNPETAAAADVRSLEKQAKWERGFTPWDMGNANLKMKVRQLLHLEHYLEDGKTWTSASLSDFKKYALSLAAQIKAVLNFTVKEEMPAVQILNQLLEQMGMECDRTQTRKDKIRIRTYTVSPLAKQRNEAVIERRKKRREQPDEGVTPPSSINEIRRGCDTKIRPQIVVGASYTWGLSLEPWVIERVDGAIAYIKGAIGAVMSVPICELIPVDTLESAS